VDPRQVLSNIGANMRLSIQAPVTKDPWRGLREDQEPPLAPTKGPEQMTAGYINLANAHSLRLHTPYFLCYNYTVLKCT